MNIRNILIIPFSRLVKEWQIKAYGEESNREKWFAFRSNILKQCLIPCLNHQSKLVDKTYILLGDGDEKYYEKYLGCLNLSPIFIKEKADFRLQLLLDLEKNSLMENVVLSKIDSDDLICKDYFLNINKQVELNQTFLTATIGYRTNLIQIEKLSDEPSPFNSQYIHRIQNPVKFIDKLKNKIPINILCHRHHIENRKHQVNQNAEWMQLIHGRNIANLLLTEAGPGPDHIKILRPLFRIDPMWFKSWAGFEVPSPEILKLNL